MACYAFYDPEKGSVEYMDEHVEGIAKCILERWETQGLVAKASRILGVERDTLRDLLLIAGLLHDFGKTLCSLQEKCRKSGCTGFPRHYSISARFVLTIVQRHGLLLPETIDERLKALLLEGKSGGHDEEDAIVLALLLPVYLHNYAHLTEKSIAEPSKERVDRVRVDKECRRVLTGIINRWLVEGKVSSSLTLTRNILMEASKVLMEPEVELSLLPWEGEGARRYLFSYIPTTERTIAEAFIGVLNICDGQVAYQNRNRRWATSRQ